MPEKKCKICFENKTSNFSIKESFLGKDLPTLIENISGVKVHTLKLKEILICQECAIALVQAATVVDKVRRAFDEQLQQKSNNKLKQNKKLTSVDTENDITENFKDSLFEFTPQLESTAAVNLDISECAADEQTVTAEHSAVVPKKRKYVKKQNAKLETTVKKPRLKSAESNNATLQQTLTKASSAHLSNASDCSKSDSTTLSNHKTSANNSKTKQFACVICGKKYAQIAELRLHMKNSHLGEVVKDCANCGARFRSQQKYETHIFSEKCKNSIHPCQFPSCNKRFTQPSKMRLHMVKMHPADTFETDEWD